MKFGSYGKLFNLTDQLTKDLVVKARSSQQLEFSLSTDDHLMFGQDGIELQFLYPKYQSAAASFHAKLAPDNQDSFQTRHSFKPGPPPKKIEVFEIEGPEQPKKGLFSWFSSLL